MRASRRDAHIDPSNRDSHGLEVSQREWLYDRLGVDTVNVRIHMGRQVDTFLEAIGSPAVTAGGQVFVHSEVVSHDGFIAPAVLVHELVHVVQQSSEAASSRRNPVTMERDAQRIEHAVLQGGRVELELQANPARSNGPRWIQGYNAWEHRLISDSTPAELRAYSDPEAREPYVTTQLAVLGLFIPGPIGVSARGIKHIDPALSVVKVGDLTATMGDVNALADFVADPRDLMGADPNFVAGLLQYVRQEAYARLRQLLDPKAEPFPFTGALGPYIDNTGLLGSIKEVQAVEAWCVRYRRGNNRYSALLARNACHFAPYNWARWRASHLEAITLRKGGPGKKPPIDHDNEALIYEAYAQHFIADGFAAGHLINKTEIMEWGIDWVEAQQYIPIQNWDWVEPVRTFNDILGAKLYVKDWQSVARDPQTAEEQLVQQQRIDVAGLRSGSDQHVRYDEYLAFLDTANLQLASNVVHDHFNSQGLAVQSDGNYWPSPKITIFGDGQLVRAEANALQAIGAAVAASMADSLSPAPGGVDRVLDQVPTQVVTGAPTPPRLWAWQDATLKKALYASVMNAWPAYAKAWATTFGNPTMGGVSVDQQIGKPPGAAASVTLPRDSTATNTDVGFLFSEGRLFAGCGGEIFELDPTTLVSKQHNPLPSWGSGMPTSLATDGVSLFFALTKWAGKVNINSISETPAYVTLGARPWLGMSPDMHLFATTSGYIYELSRQDLSTLQTNPLKGAGTGDLSTAMSNPLIVGLDGWVAALERPDLGALWWASLKGIVQTTVATDGTTSWAVAGGSLYSIAPAAGSGTSYPTGRDLGFGPWQANIVLDDYVYVTSRNVILAVDPLNASRTVWTTSLGQTPPGMPITPPSIVVLGEVLVVGLQQRVWFLNKLIGREVVQSVKLTPSLGDVSLVTDGSRVWAGCNGTVTLINVL